MTYGLFQYTYYVNFCSHWINFALNYINHCVSELVRLAPSHTYEWHNSSDWLPATSKTSLSLRAYIPFRPTTAAGTEQQDHPSRWQCDAVLSWPSSALIVGLSSAQRRRRRSVVAYSNWRRTNRWIAVSVSRCYSHPVTLVRQFRPRACVDSVVDSRLPLEFSLSRYSCCRRLSRCPHSLI